MRTDNLKSKLGKAKGFGSARSGARHWWHQRMTAILLAILVVWLLFFVRDIALASTSMELLSVVKKPCNITILGLFVITSFYHGMLGMTVIIEDYISCTKMRAVLIIALKLFCIITVSFFIVALFYTIIP